MRLPDERGHDMARFQIEIVARAIEIGRHGGNEIAAIFAPIGAASFRPAILAMAYPSLVVRASR